MKKRDEDLNTKLTIEKVLETFNLMRQLRITRSIIEMSKELGVKRTELMKYINEHPKNINWDVYRFSNNEVAVVTGVFLDPHENPRSEEYADDRRKEHWIRLERIFYEGWVHGFQPALDPVGGTPVTHSWENQKEDIEKYLTLPGIGEHRFALGYAMGSHYSDWHTRSVKPADFNKMIEEGHKLGLRFHMASYGDDEINELIDLGECNFSYRK